MALFENGRVEALDVVGGDEALRGVVGGDAAAMRGDETGSVGGGARRFSLGGEDEEAKEAGGGRKGERRETGTGNREEARGDRLAALAGGADGRPGRRAGEEKGDRNSESGTPLK